MSEWLDLPLERLADISSGGTPSRANPAFWGGDIPWVTPSDITACKTNHLLEVGDYISEKGLSSSSAKILPQGALLLTSRATIGDVKIAATPLATNQGFKNIVAHDQIDGDFLFYQLTRLKGSFIRYAAGSTFLEINRRDTGRILVPHPKSKSVQQKIARILQTIDRAIEQTGALIDKYQQIKAGLMQDLFTRGIGPDGQLRPPREQAPHLYQQTPIGWIPKEWELLNLGGMAKIVSGVTLGPKESLSDTVEVPYLRVANVQDGYLDLSEIKTVRISRKALDYLRLLPGDVLMNEGGDFDKLGRGAVWAGEIKDCVHQNHVFRVRTDSTVLNPLYLAYYSESAFGKKYFLLSSKQSTNLASINSKQLNTYPIALPASEEQDEIIRRIGGAKLQIDSLKTEAEKLQKQKSGLMHDLLTGNVHVPESPNFGE